MESETDMKEKTLMPFHKGALGEKIAEGSHASVYAIRNRNGGESLFVVKIGETVDYMPPLLGAIRITCSRRKASRFLETYLGKEFKIMPDEEMIRNGVAEYMLMKQYLGYEEKDGQAVSEKRNELILALQDRTHPFYREIQKVFGSTEYIDLACRSLQDQQTENFLPREQAVIGHAEEVTSGDLHAYQFCSIKTQLTYYLLQERIAGEEVMPLAEIRGDILRTHPLLLERLLLFTLLTKKMYWDTGKLIDTRPKEILKHPFEWFQKTVNILADVKRERVYFIDTRWLWDSKSVLGAGGINFIDCLGIRSVDRAIRRYAELLTKK